MHKKNMKKEGDLVREDAPKPTIGKPSPGDLSSDSYILYFKGLRNWQWQIATGLTLAGFGVAIQREDDDNILFQMNGLLDDSDVSIWEVEFMALKLGLNKALSLGINHISFYCDDHDIFELVMGRLAPTSVKIALLMDDVQTIRQKFTTSIPVLVTRTRPKFVFDLAMETLPKPLFGKAGNMFSVACSHRFGVEYMKEQIELTLNQGGLPRCPHPGCKSNLTLRSCAHLLTPKLKEMWEQRVNEDSIPVCDRFHCPNPSCWGLMSKTELLESSEDGVRISCYKCRKPFCINCKVMWHSNLSCAEYRRSGGKPSTTLWRQCRSCQHMNKLFDRRITVTCRCGYRFCYKCGSQWKFGGCFHHHQFLMKVVVALVFFLILFYV
ncbi:PREDICTED: uncharacterized protein LOC104783799 [Camelina sativa]|uniref:RBR-type E3 ubiquitin transferase n=1 Tax=Camelina sativa TaxID=90675 RepID=A0ABM0YX40_CAMSA|nr:PREDICTED: uncharacterized protein LOC104783799 [Camelina sativa]